MKTKTAAIAIGAAAGFYALFVGIISTSTPTKPIADPAAEAAAIQEGVKALAVQDCRKNLIAQLNDPDSFRELERTVVAHTETKGYLVGIKYTATNGFGGRVTDHHFCDYSEKA